MGYAPLGWKHMEIHLRPELEARLASLAAEQGREPDSLIEEAIERLVHYDEWFMGEVEKGLNAADRGELMEHEEIGEMLGSRFPG